MTIRNRLTWLFTGLVAVLLLGALSVAYLSQAQYAHQEFHQRLRDRAEVTAYVFLEQDELHESAFRAFQNRYLQVLSGEILQIYDAARRVRFVEQDARLRVPEAMLARIVTEKEVFFDVGSRQAVGILYRDNQGEYIVVAAAENRAGQARLRHLAEMLALVFAGSLGVVYVAGRVFAGRALAPIAAVNDQVDHITAQDLHHRVDEGLSTHEQDEITRLARTFNRMLERLEESFESQRAFVRNASHELRTPLTATIGELQVLLARERNPAAYREGLGSVLGELLQLKTLLNNLLELTQAAAGTTTPDDIRLDELLWEARQAVAPDQRHRVLIGLGELPADAELLELRGNRPLLCRAFVNLFDNALKYSGPEAPVHVHLSCRAGRRQVRVQDQGLGIDAKALPNIFQPFYRADNARGVSGHGVGLPLARRILELHGGTLRVTSGGLGQGTLVEVEV